MNAETAPSLIPGPQVLIDSWPPLARWFFALCGVVLALIAAIGAERGELRSTLVPLALGVALTSLFFLENRTLLDAACQEVILRFKWLLWRSERQFPLANVTHLYVRSLGEGGCEIGLKLADGSEVALSRPMGSHDDKQAFASQVAARLGVAVVWIPFAEGPSTNRQLVLMNLIYHAFGALWGFVAWIAATRPSTGGQIEWSVVWVCSGVAALVVTSTWYHTIRELRRRRAQ